MRHTAISFALAAMLSATLACTNKKSATSDDTPAGLTVITDEQFAGSNMTTGTTSTRTFRDMVRCKGYVFAPSNQMSRLSPFIAGKVASLNYRLGDRVASGQIIATISSNEFMALQQDFAEAAATFHKVKTEYERVKALWSEKIGAEKDFISAETSYRTALTSYESLRSRLAALHVSTAKVEKGHLYSSFPVVAPISGFITEINAVIGQFVNVDSYIVEIVNTSGLQLRLAVYAPDVQLLKAGQKVLYSTAEQPQAMLEARLHSVGNTIDNDSKTVDCVAAISPTQAVTLINDSYVDASVVVSQHHAKALPLTAIQKDDDQCFVYVVENHKGGRYTLRKLTVEVCITDSGFMEIKTPLDRKTILMQGIETLS